MSKSTLNYAETTDIADYSEVLSDVLKSLRISGSLLINEDYAAPWGVSIPDADSLRGFMKLGRGVQVVAFHFVKRGYIEITHTGKEQIIIEAGEIAICFGGIAHQLSQGTNKTLIEVESLLMGSKNPFQPEECNKMRSTALICGAFLMHNVALNPLFASLPPILKVSTLHPRQSHNLPRVLKWMIEEAEHKTLGSHYVIERLLELLCAEVLRSHLENTPVSESKWLCGIKDPIVGRAIAMIHAKLGNDWSVNRLAQGVAMSPSRFAARFSAAIGDSPMVYVTKWRMNVAGRLLDESQQGVSEISANLGYDNVAAFTRAFKRYMGVPPVAWRTRQH